MSTCLCIKSRIAIHNFRNHPVPRSVPERMTIRRKITGLLIRNSLPRKVAVTISIVDQSMSTSPEEPNRPSSGSPISSPGSNQSLGISNLSVQEGEPSDNCTVCLEHIESDRYTTACGHHFHSRCLNQHLHSGSTSCPNCRADLSEPGQEGEDVGWDNDDEGTALFVTMRPVEPLGELPDLPPVPRAFTIDVDAARQQQDTIQRSARPPAPPTPARLIEMMMTPDASTHALLSLHMSDDVVVHTIFPQVSCSRCSMVHCCCLECSNCCELRPEADFNVACWWDDCGRELYCSDCMYEADDDHYYHSTCLPIEWNLNDAFNKWGFDDGDSDRNYNETVADVIRELGYTVSTDGWGCHNLVIDEISRDGEVVYGGDGYLWLGGYHSFCTIGNTLPPDIVAALRQFDEDCDIEGYNRLDEQLWETDCQRPDCHWPVGDPRHVNLVDPCLPCPNGGRNSHQQFLCCPLRVRTMVHLILNDIDPETRESIVRDGIDAFEFLEDYGLSTEDICDIFDLYYEEE